jgi:putative zinc finger/helix-turn-helix YgiT family protein
MKRCRNCGTHSVVERVEDRPFDSLPSVQVQGLNVVRCGKCGMEAVSIPRLEQLHEVVAKSLVKKPGLLTGAEVRYLRKWLGWSGRDFASRFALSPEHVSRIENGHHPISVVADRLLRLLVVIKAPIDNYTPEDMFDLEVSDEPFELGIRTSTRGWVAAA